MGGDRLHCTSTVYSGRKKTGLRRFQMVYTAVE